MPEIFAWSRLAIWFAALFSLLVFEGNRHPRANVWDGPMNHDSGWIFGAWARWDSGWYLNIAHHGYGFTDGAGAFFPLYPLTVAGLGRVFLGHYVAAAVLISLVCCLGAFLLVHRLAEERLGADGARRAVLYLAVFPTALFLQAAYSESLYLLLAVAAFFLAERRRWSTAWGVVALATLTRFAGFALVPAIGWLAWRSPERRRALAPAAIVPALFVWFPFTLWRWTGDAWSFLHSQDLWHRSLSPAGPFGGLWFGVRDGFEGLWGVLSGAPAQRYGIAEGADYWLRVDALNLENLVFLALFVALTVIAWRRLGPAYGLFAAFSLAIPLSVPAEKWPLLSLSRFGVVVFPFFLALAILGGRPRVHTAILAVSALFLGVSVVQWALWQWVA